MKNIFLFILASVLSVSCLSFGKDIEKNNSAAVVDYAQNSRLQKSSTSASSAIFKAVPSAPIAQASSPKSEAITATDVESFAAQSANKNKGELAFVPVTSVFVETKKENDTDFKNYIENIIDLATKNGFSSYQNIDNNLSIVRYKTASKLIDSYNKEGDFIAGMASNQWASGMLSCDYYNVLSVTRKSSKDKYRYTLNLKSIMTTTGEEIFRSSKNFDQPKRDFKILFETSEMSEGQFVNFKPYFSGQKNDTFLSSILSFYQNAMSESFSAAKEVLANGRYIQLQIQDAKNRLSSSELASALAEAGFSVKPLGKAAQKLRFDLWHPFSDAKLEEQLRTTLKSVLNNSAQIEFVMQDKISYLYNVVELR